MNLAKFLFLLTIFIFPYYVLPSGGFQPSSATLLLCLAAMMISKNVPLLITPAIFYQALFVSYVFVVNAMWVIVSHNTGFLLYIVIGIFTTIIFFTSVTVTRSMDNDDGRRFLQVILLTLLVQILIYWLDLGRPGYRAIIYFNNPNQLGYFCVLSATFAIVAGHIFKVKGVIVPAILVASLILASFSLSKAAILSCTMTIVIMLFFSRSLTVARKIAVSMIIAATLIASADSIKNTESYERFDHRINGFRPDNDDSLSHRGYSRIFDYPENIIWGAGEGYVSRFKASIELHSYPATILFSYGIIGSMLFALFIKHCIVSWRMVLYLTPVAFYNLTHHGGRTLIFWILLGMIAAAMENRRDDKATAQSESESESDSSDSMLTESK